MRFIGTRCNNTVTCSEAVKSCVTAGGGLLVPEQFPVISDGEMKELIEADYVGRVAFTVKKFFGEIVGEDIYGVLEEAFSSFDGSDPVPIMNVGESIFMLETFRGPTCSSKDLAVTLLPYLFEKSGIKGEMKIICATSGDTGKAVLQSFSDKAAKIMVLYPAEGTSKIQRLQLVTHNDRGVKVLAFKGDFDECLETVREAAEKHGLLCANSLNFASVAPRIAIFLSAYLDMLSSERIADGEQIDFYIPVGNFGNAIAAYYAKLMGVPVRKIHCACNDNDVVSSFIKTGVLDIGRQAVKTTSPNLDVLNPANVERLLFELSGRNAALTAERMSKLESSKKITLTDGEKEELSKIFDGGWANEETCVEAMYDVYVDTDYVMDTNTGCAMKVAHDWYEKNKKDETKAVIVATENPYKFPQDVLYAMTGNDVKDSFKGIKRLRDATGLPVPACLKELKEKPVIHTAVCDKKRAADEIAEFFGL